MADDVKEQVFKIDEKYRRDFASSLGVRVHTLGFIDTPTQFVTAFCVRLLLEAHRDPKEVCRFCTITSVEFDRFLNEHEQVKNQPSTNPS